MKHGDKTFDRLLPGMFLQRTTCVSQKNIGMNFLLCHFETVAALTCFYGCPDKKHKP